MRLDTANLELIGYAPGQILALIDGYARFEKSFGLPAADGLRSFIASDEVSPEWLARLRAASTPDPWTHGFAIVDRSSRSVVGGVGFKGPPDADGMVEIAYGVVPGFQCRGYATEAAQAGVAFAFKDGRVRVVRAHTRPIRNPSTRVLEKCGFTFRGEVEEPEDGLVWRWERQRGPQSAVP